MNRMNQLCARPITPGGRAVMIIHVEPFLPKSAREKRKGKFRDERNTHHHDVCIVNASLSMWLTL
jgi:hypothetical protein